MHLREQVTQPADPSYRLIALTRGQVCKVDAADYDWLNQWLWFAQWDPKTRSFRAARGSPRRVYMHREIMPTKEGILVDHADSDTLNNRRGNLRPATNSQNTCNSRIRSDNKSGFKGAVLHKATGKYGAEIRIGRRRKWLGVFDTAEEAHQAWSKAASENYGEFARYA